MKISSFVLLFLAQLSGCAGFLCSLPDAELKPRQLSISFPSIEAIGRLSADDFVVVTRPSRAPTALEVTHIVSNHEETIGTTPALFPCDTNQFVFGNQNRWWFSVQGNQGAQSSVFFFVSGEQNQPRRVNLPRRFPLVWLPIRGDEPRGVEVSVENEQPSLRIDEVTPSGTKLIAAFPWWEAGFQHTVLSSRWSAEALGEGRFAVVAVDGPPGGMTLRLRVVGDRAEPVESPIPCSVAIDYPLATAVDGSGRLAVVGRAKDGSVVGVTVDAARPESARCSVISAPGEVAAMPPFGTPAVVWSGEAFVSAWIREDGTVRVSELGKPGVVDAGRGADVHQPLHQLLYTDGDYVTLVWKERGGAFVERPLPRNVAGYAFATEVSRLFCRVAGREYLKQ